jgi:hypothetical protein
VWESSHKTVERGIGWRNNEAAASVVSTNTMDWTTLLVYSYMHQTGLHVPVEPFRFLLRSKLAWIFGLSASWRPAGDDEMPAAPAVPWFVGEPRRGIESAFMDASETCSMGLAGVCDLVTVIRRSLGYRFCVCFCSPTHTHMVPS